MWTAPHPAQQVNPMQSPLPLLAIALVLNDFACLTRFGVDDVHDLLARACRPDSSAIAC